jgi:hypothetical protein
MNAALVELIEHDGAKLRKERILLEAGCQHALGRHQQSCSGTEPPLEPDLPADLFTNGPPALVGDALRDGTCGDTARLKQDYRAVGSERRRDACRLPRTRLGGNDDSARSPNTFGDRLDERIDGKGFEARGS